MSRLSRKDAAKSVIAVWRWLAEQEQPIEGNAPTLLARLPADVGNLSRETPNGLTDRLALMEHLGLIRRDSFHEYVAATDGKHKYPAYRAAIVLLEKDVEKGAKTIAQHFARGGFLKVNAKGNRKVEAPASLPRAAESYDPNIVAIRTDERDRPVEAVVGEDAPTIGEGLAQTGQASLLDRVREARKPTDAEAFVAAARQYENRNDFVIAKLKEIEALGIEIDREKVLKGVHLQRDDELEGVVKVLPLIDELLGKVKQADGWRGDMLSAQREMRTLRDEKNRIAAELAKQQDANKRLANKMAQDVVAGANRGQSQVLVG